MSQRNAVLDAQAHEIVINHIERLGAERNVIAYILHNPDSVYDVAMALRDIDFNNTINKAIYGHMMNLMGKNVSITQSTITAVMKQHDKIRPEDVDSYLDTIGKTNTFNMDLKYNLNLVKSASVKRQTYHEALNILLDCTSEEFDEPVDGFLGRQQGRFLDLSLQLESADRVVNFADIVGGYLEEKSKNPQMVPGILTSFPQLDISIGGLNTKRLYVFAARAKAGKSAILLNIGCNISILAKEKTPTLMVSTEMTDDEMLGRLIAKVSGVPEKLISNGMYTQNEEMTERVIKAKELIESGDFFHVYLPNFTPETITSLARKYKQKHGVKVLIFDYLKIPSSNHSSLATHILLGKLTTALKDIGGTENLVVCTAAQLNRQASGEEHLSDDMVRGSDEILFYADYLFMLRNKSEKELEDEDGGLGNSLLHLVASRHGGDYIGAFNFKKECLHFEEIMNIA